MTLNIHIISRITMIMTFYEENYGQNELNFVSLNDVHACLQTHWKWSHGESLAWYCSAARIIFNISLFEYFVIQQITLIYI